MKTFLELHKEEKILIFEQIRTQTGPQLCEV
jgi:hypothetical protein